MGIGLSELILLAAISLVVMGPDKFPGFAKMVVRTWRDLRSYADDMKTDLAKELRPVEREMKQLTRYDVNTYVNKPASPKPAATTVTATAVASATTAESQTPAPPEDAQNVVDSGVGELEKPVEMPEDRAMEETAFADANNGSPKPAIEIPVAKGDYSD